MATLNDDALKGQLTFSLILAVLATGLGSSFIFGYNIGVINAAGATIKKWIAENEFSINCTTNCHNYTDNQYLDALTKADKTRLDIIWGWVGGIFPFGAMIGGIMTGFVADRFGRKGGMLLNTLLTFAGGLIMSFSSMSGMYGILILGRFVIGLNCGLNSGLAPMYLTEISPVNYRGSLGSVNQLAITVSILLANILGLENLLGTASLWPYLLGFTMVPAIFQLLVLPFCPESPKYLLINKGQEESARAALMKLRQTIKTEAEMNLMEDEAKKAASSAKVQFVDMFKDPVLRWALLIAAVQMLSQQFSGINAAMFYSTEIFKKDANLSDDASLMATLGINVVNVLMTVLATAIIDKAGRRTLQLTGLGGMFIFTILLVVSMCLSGAGYGWSAYLSIIFVVLYIIFFAMGPGPIPWFYVSECFEQGARGHANSAAVGINWFAACIVTLLFPPVRAALGQFTFLIFVAFLAVSWLFIWKWAPETKGKSVDQVLAELRHAVNGK